MKRLNIATTPTNVLGVAIPLGAFYGCVECEFTRVFRRPVYTKNGGKHYETVSYSQLRPITYYCHDFTRHMDGSRPYFALWVNDGRRWRHVTYFVSEYAAIYNLIDRIRQRVKPRNCKPFVTNSDRSFGDFPKERKAQARYDFAVHSAGYALDTRIMTDDINAVRRQFVKHTNW